MYLRGVIQLELKPILDFIYSGQASFYQERMKDFLKIGKDLQIKEIKEVPEEDGMANSEEKVVNKPGLDRIAQRKQAVQTSNPIIMRFLIHVRSSESANDSNDDDFDDGDN